MMTWAEANEAWDNGLISLDELENIAVCTLRGSELEDALADIEAVRNA